VRRSMRAIRQALGSTAINPALLSCAERLQYDGYLRREEAHSAIRALAGTGVPIKDIVRRTGRSRKLVRGILLGSGHDVFRSRTGMLEPHLTWLEAEWCGGCRNGAELWRRLRNIGFMGGLRVVTEWATRRRRAEKTAHETARKVPPVRLIARLMTAMRDHLTKADAMMVAAVEHAVPALTSARTSVEQFHQMLRAGDVGALPAWIADAAGTLLSSFVRGVVADQAAVSAALEEPWSNGQTEGQITKLKLVKRQMYGRGKLDLLRARLLTPA
jgi:transposase